MASGKTRKPVGSDQVVMSELEAAEALAVLSRCSASGSGSELNSLGSRFATEAVVRPSQDQATAMQRFSGHTSSKITSPEKTAQTVETIPIQSCSTSYQSNPAGKSKKTLTEGEKEAQRLRRVLANRESARQTIRRRQAMYLELTKKAADLSEENENLKKEKELVEEEYSSLRGRNAFLKAQMARIKKGQTREMQEDPKSSHTETSNSASTSTPIYLHNQPSLIPCFLSSILPPSEILQFQNTDPAKFSMPHGDPSCSHRGQENCLGTNRPGTPFLVLPVPWLLPFITHGCNLHSHSVTSDRQNETPVSVNQNITNHHGARVSGPEGTVPCVKPVENSSHIRHSQANDTSDVNVVSASENITRGSSKKKREPIICTRKRTEDAFAATEARRKRKELMRLKNNHLL